MATISFIIFMIIGYFLSNILDADSSIKILLYSIFFPILIFISTVIIYGEGNAYKSGQVAAECLISTIVMIILMIVRFNSKLKTKS